MAERARSLAFRLVAGAGFWLTLGFVAAAMLLSTLFRDFVEREFDARLSLLLDTLIAVSQTDETGDLATPIGLDDPRFEQPYSGWYWQVSAPDMKPLRSRSLWDKTLVTTAAAADGEPHQYDTEGPNDQPIRVLTRAITLPDSDRRYYYSVAGSRADIDAEVRNFDRILLISLSVLGLVLIGAVFLQVRVGLAPLRNIPPALAAIRSGRRQHLEGPFPLEVAPLARELNALLDHNQEVVERARTHVGNLAHALKTPLAVLTNEAQSNSGRLAETALRQTDAMRRHVDHHLTRARAAARAGVLGARSEVMPVIEDLRRTLQAIYAERALTIDADGDGRLAFRGERQDLEEMLGNLMDNGCKWARSRLRVVARRAEGAITISVEDDGPGLDAGQRESAITRGHRLDENAPGSGLGLAIVRDIAGLYGGELTLDDSALGGLAAVLRLPAAEAG